MSFSSFHLQLIFGIHGLSATPCAFKWQVVRFGKFLEEWIRSRQMVRYDAFRPQDFVYRFAWIWANLAADHVFVLARADHRFGQIDGIGNHRHECQSVGVPDEMLDHAGTLTSWNAIAADPAFLEMGCVDR